MRRGNTVEATHVVHVASTDGYHRGDADLVCHFRSSMKPLQEMPLVESYEELTDDGVAIACASHEAEPAQLAAVRTLLARAVAVEETSSRRATGTAHGKLGHNCSGKHAGMLAACRANGWPMHPYRDPDHQRSAASSNSSVRGDVAVDGCGVPTVAMPIKRMAERFTTIPTRIVEAMLARPEPVGGPAPTTPT